MTTRKFDSGYSKLKKKEYFLLNHKVMNKFIKINKKNKLENTKVFFE